MPQRLLEINSALIWHWSHFQDAIRLVEKYRFNGLIIHQQNILALLAKPSPHYHGADSNNLHHERDAALLYLQRASQYCRQRQLTLWLQGEAFPEDGKLQHKFPELALADSPGRGESFLRHFYQVTISEALAGLPLVSGVILSLQTPVFHQAQWHAPLQMLYRQLRQQGKKLVLRDYTDDSWPRRQLPVTLGQLPADVRASLKMTAVDYRPGFANNPAIGSFGERNIWIDIDLWGIDYGWTLLPCNLIDELQGRLGWVNSVIGARLETLTARVSWEWINNSSLPDSVNECNLYALAQMLSDSTPVSSTRLLDQWLGQRKVKGLDMPHQQALQQLFVSSYDWMCRTPYMLGRMMHQHSQVPHDMNSAMRLLHADERSANRSQSLQPLFPLHDAPLGHHQRDLILLEQQQGEFFAQRLYQQALGLQRSGTLPPELADMLAAAWERADWYTRMFSHARGLIARHWFISQYGSDATLRAGLQQQVAAAERFALTLNSWLDKAVDRHPYYLRILLDPERLSLLAQDSAAPITVNG